MFPQVQGSNTMELLFVGIYEGFSVCVTTTSKLSWMEIRLAEAVLSVNVLEEMECKHLPCNSWGSYEVPLQLTRILQGFPIDLLCPINEKCQFQFLWVFETSYIFLNCPVWLVIMWDIKDSSPCRCVSDGQWLCVTLNAQTKTEIVTHVTYFTLFKLIIKTVYNIVEMWWNM
jgi:hypothetical protein